MRAAALIVVLIGGSLLAQAPSPTLTELERTKLENIQLKEAMLRQQFAELEQQKTALIAEAEKAHPGFAVDPNTYTLVAKPKPSPSPTPAK